MAKTNGHEHIHTEKITEPNTALEIITITTDPKTGQISYSFRNSNYATVLQRLALTQFLVYDDMKKDLAKRLAETTAANPEIGSL